MAERSLYWIIGAKTGPFQKALRGIQTDLGQVQRSFTAASKTLMASLTVPIVGAAAAATKMAVSFESAFAGVRKTVDATEEEFAALRKGLVDMTKETPATFEDLSKIAEAAGQLGIKKENILDFTKVIADLAVTTNLTSDQAAMDFARIASIIQLPQTQFSNMGSTVVDLGNKFATTEADIVAMALNIAGAANVVGMQAPAMFALATGLSSVGMEAQAGGTAISKVMMNVANAVADGGEKLGKFAQVAGMSAREFATAWKTDPAGALVSFIEGLARLNDQGDNVFQTMDDLSLSEVRVMKSLLGAAGAGDLFRRALETGNTAWEENSALTEEAAKRYATTESQLGILKNNFRAIGDTVGSTLLPRINDLIKAGGPLVKWVEDLAAKFAGLSAEQQTNILKWAGILAAVGPVLMVIGSFAGGLKNIIGLVGTVAQMAKGLAGAFSFLLSPAGLVVAAITAIIAVGVLLYKNWDKIASVARTVWDAVVDTIKRAVNGVISIINGFIGLINKIPGINIPLIGKFELSGEREARLMQEAAAAAAGAVATTSYKSTGGTGAATAAVAAAGIRRFATGGEVPGPIGLPQLAVVHGGEEVLTPSQRGGSVVVNVTGNYIKDDYDVRRLANKLANEIVRNLKLAGVTV